MGKKPFDGYRRKGKLLQTFWNNLRDELRKQGTELASNAWRDERLPDFLWLGLVLLKENSETYTALLEISKTWPPGQGVAIPATPASHTYIAALETDARQKVVRAIVSIPGAADFLRPLRLLETLPAYADWAEHLPEPQEDVRPNPHKRAVFLAGEAVARNRRRQESKRWRERPFVSRPSQAPRYRYARPGWLELQLPDLGAMSWKFREVQCRFRNSL